MARCESAEDIRDHGIAFDKAVKAFPIRTPSNGLTSARLTARSAAVLFGMCEGVILHATYTERGGGDQDYFSPAGGAT